MRERPWELILLAAMPLAALLFLPLDPALIALAVLTSVFCWRSSSWAFAAMPLYSIVVIYEFWRASIEPGIGLAYGAALGAICLTPRAKKALLKPELRWWLRSHRWKVNVPVRVKVLDTGAREFYSKTFDISETGAFIPVEKIYLQKFRPGTQCFVSIPLGGIETFQCRAEIVRSASEEKGAYPSGVGVKFLGLDWQERRKISSHFSELEAIRRL